MEDLPRKWWYGWFCRLGIMKSIYMMGGIPFSTSQSLNHDGNINQVRGVSSKLDGDMMDQYWGL
jgi:hypothetical protein